MRYVESNLSPHLPVLTGGARRSPIVSRVVLITGASSGLGRAIAAHLAAEGCRVFGTSRDPGAHMPPGVTPLVMDVTADELVAEAVQTLTSQTNGRIDVLVNNAGISIVGPVEGHSSADAYKQIDTNLFGVLRVCRLVLPAMREQGRGLIINIGSIASALPMPMQGFYSASKAGLAAITHSLRLELAPMGLDVVLVEPGNYRTQITAQRQRTDVPPAYATMLERAISTIARDEINGNDPAEVARLVGRIVRARRRRALYRIGPWPERLFLALVPLLPRRLLDVLMSNYYLSQ